MKFHGTMYPFGVQEVITRIHSTSPIPANITGEATKWLVKLHKSSIKSWEDLVTTFHKRFFPPSKMMKLRDDIQNFKQKKGEPIHESWTRFKKFI